MLERGVIRVNCATRVCIQTSFNVFGLCSNTNFDIAGSKEFNAAQFFFFFSLACVNAALFCKTVINWST